MNIKQYFKNLWDKLVNDESGQLPGPWNPTKTYYPGQYTPPKKITDYIPFVGGGTAKTTPYVPFVGGGTAKYTPYPSVLTAALPMTATKPATGGTITDVITGQITQPPQVTKQVTGGGQFALMGYPEMPDLAAGLSPGDISRLESESGMLAELEFAPAFRQLGQNLIESKRIATEEREEAVPVYEKSMRDVAATVANAIGGWAQKLNQLGMLRSGSYGRGISRLETAGIAEKGGLQKALNERLENISTREADYERDVLDLRAGLEKEKGLRQSTTFERLKREELVYQRDTRQMTFQNEVQRATFVNTMNQMIWQRDMSEKQLNAQLEAQSLENQMLQARISSLYGAGATKAQGYEIPGVGTLTPAQAIQYGYAPTGEYGPVTGGSDLENYIMSLLQPQ